MLEFIQVATGKLPVKARFIIVVCTYCKRINKVSIIIKYFHGPVYIYFSFIIQFKWTSISYLLLSEVYQCIYSIS